MASGDSSSHVLSREYAVSLDAQDLLGHMRAQFLIPTKAQLELKSLPEAGKRCASSTSSPLGPSELMKSIEKSSDFSSHDLAIYLCGNSLGLQPRLTLERMHQYFTTWATQGVFGHFKSLVESPLPTWLDADTRASELMAPIVGAQPSEVAVMQTLTANLHLLMAAFYKPDIKGRHKIIIETQAFPSDHVSHFLYLILRFMTIISGF